MLQPKTHFEQVPLEIVKEIVEQQIRRETTTQQDQGTRKKTLEGALLGAQKQSMARFRTFSQLELGKQS